MSPAPTPGQERSEGWWDNMIGPANRWTPTVLRHRRQQPGLVLWLTGPMHEPGTGQPWGADFPVVTVEDWVTRRRAAGPARHPPARRRAGRQPGRHAGPRGRCATPQRLRHAGGHAPNLTAQNIAFNEVARARHRHRPEFHGGHFYATA